MDRVRVLFGALASAGLLASLSPEAGWAYVPTVTSNGTSVTWRGDHKLNLAGNPLNRSGIDAESIRAAVVRSLQRWQAAAGGGVRFDYWQGTDPGVYEANTDYNGLSSLSFVSNARGGAPLASNVLGVTQVWYETRSGEILESDILLNDRDFEFTTRPQDTSGYGSGGPTPSSGGRNRVFIENVLTHELGHAYGLSHSGGLQSTMLFMESPEQAHLGCDEHAAVRALYPGLGAGARGSIGGSVISESGDPVFGAHVLAISRKRGTVLATAVSGPSGGFEIRGLEPGAYFLMVEPYYAGATALPDYYSVINDRICPGRDRFARGFWVESDGSTPRVATVGAGGRAAAGPVIARCSSGEGALVSARESEHRFADAPIVFDGAGSAQGFGSTTHFAISGGPVYYRLRGVEGRLEVHALSYSLYSPVRPSLALLDDRGYPVRSAQADDRVYSGDSGYVNYDAALVAEGLVAGEYVVEVTPGPLQASLYPAASVALDSAPFLLLTGSVNEGASPLAAELPENARCRGPENFATYSSPPGNPLRRDIHVADEESEGGGFCGSLNWREGLPPGGMPPGAIAGWFLPWATMMMTLVIARRFKAIAKRMAQGPVTG